MTILGNFQLAYTIKKITFSAVNIWGVPHLNNRAFSPTLFDSHKSDELLQKLAYLQNRSSEMEQRKLKYFQEHAGDHKEKAQLSGENTSPQYEYLSLALARNAIHPVQLYGYAETADGHFLKRAESLLTILRIFSILEKAPDSQPEQEHFALLLPEVSDLLYDILYGPIKHRKL